MITLLLAIVLLAIAVGGIAIKLIVKKNGEFKKSCSSIDPKTGKPADCSCGGSEEDHAKCENYIEHHGEGTEE